MKTHRLWNIIGLMAAGVVIAGSIAPASIASSNSRFNLLIELDCSLDFLSDGTAIQKLALPPGCEPEPPVEPPPDNEPSPEPTPEPEEEPPAPSPIAPPLLNPALLPAGGSAILDLISKNVNLTVDNGSSVSEGFWSWTAATLVAIVIVMLMVITLNIAIYHFTGISFLGSAFARLHNRYNGVLPPKKDINKKDTKR